MSREEDTSSVDLEGVYTWESQARQYPETGPYGISYYAGETALGTVDCLLYRDIGGRLLGILNYYGKDFPPYEEKGNINVWVHPDHQRTGIGTKLLSECHRRYGPLNFQHQRYTREGRRFMQKWVLQHGTERPNVPSSGADEPVRGQEPFVPWGICRHCGDHTERDEDPAADLCLMCAKAGRTSAPSLPHPTGEPS